MGDCAYGDGETRRRFREAGRRLEAPVPRPPRTGKIPKTEFRIGRKLDRVRCPAGKTTFSCTRRTLPANRAGRRRRTRVFKFAAEDCASCPLKESCVGERDGPRTITLHPQEKEMRRARRHQDSKAFRRAKVRRQVVEHRIARLRQLGVRTSRYMGRAKTEFQLLMAATVANLTLVAGAAGASGSFFAALRWALAAWMVLIGLRASKMPARASRRRIPIPPGGPQRASAIHQNAMLCVATPLKTGVSG